MFDSVKSRWHSSKEQTSQVFSFSRPLVLLQSDGWGRIGVRDREGYEQLRASGIRLGQNPYDYYSLETSEDVIALRDMLKRHRDSTGRAACLVMNFLLANLDFRKTADTGFRTHSFDASEPGPAWRVEAAGTLRSLPTGHFRRRLLSGTAWADPFLPAGSGASIGGAR